jgi:hypothetical protein
MSLHLACRLRSTSHTGSDPNTPVRRSADRQAGLVGDRRLYSVNAVQVAYGVLREATAPPGHQGPDHWRLQTHSGS